MQETRIGKRTAGPRRVLLVKRSSLGDIVNALPTLVALRRGLPDAYIAWLVEARFAPILAGHECLDEIIPVRRYQVRQLLPLIGELRRIKRVLRTGSFDIAVDLQGLIKSSLMCYLSGAPRRIGFTDERPESMAGLINERAASDCNLHAVDRYLTMAAHLGCPTEPVTFRLPIAEVSRQWATDFLSNNVLPGNQPVVGLSLGASRPHKCWPVPHFARLAELLYNDLAATLVLIGASAERERVQSVKQQVTVPVCDAVGQTTLAQLPALIERCDVLVSGDSGPMHIAVAVGTPVVALMGPTFPHLTGPYGDNNIVLWSQPECACGNKAACRDYRCMHEILPEDAGAAVKQLLARTR